LKYQIDKIEIEIDEHEKTKSVLNNEKSVSQDLFVQIKVLREDHDKQKKAIEKLIEQAGHVKMHLNEEQ